MKKIEAVVRHFKLEDVKNLLVDNGFDGMTVQEVRGFGRQKGHTEIYRGTEYSVDFVPKVQLTIVVPERMSGVPAALIRLAAQTGQIGDGKMFISHVEDAIRVRTGERGHAAL